MRWCWYSLSNVDYPTGNLADANSSELTPLGQDFKAYLDKPLRRGQSAVIDSKA